MAKTKKRAATRIAVRRAAIPSDLTYDTMSELGRDLFDMSREYEESGEPMLSEGEIECEIALRRGEYIKDDAA
ncbi:MAG: hypothetical protein M3R15_13100 [Acidobacteriota bacterium]|nr:hypothetical protein [Acidobacteriota bacterium]